MSEKTTYTIALDDPTMERLLNRAAEEQRPPKVLLEEIVRAVLANGTTPPQFNSNATKH